MCGGSFTPLLSFSLAQLLPSHLVLFLAHLRVQRQCKRQLRADLQPSPTTLQCSPKKCHLHRSLSLTQCGSPWWPGLRGSLSVNLWWPVVGFVDFVVDFCWIVVVGGGFFLLIVVGFCWFVMAGCGFFVDFAVDFCWVGGCRWRIWLFFIGLWWPADIVMLCCVFFIIYFTLLQTHCVEYFPEYFLRMQTNTEKKNIFPEIICIRKYIIM
jgi:hypothetical protein